jgi:hypothetical protein
MDCGGSLFLRSNADCMAVLPPDVRRIGGTAKWDVLNMAIEYVPCLNTIAAFDSKRNRLLRKKRLFRSSCTANATDDTRDCSSSIVKRPMKEHEENVHNC